MFQLAVRLSDRWGMVPARCVKTLAWRHHPRKTTQPLKTGTNSDLFNFVHNAHTEQ